MLKASILALSLIAPVVALPTAAQAEVDIEPTATATASPTGATGRTISVDRSPSQTIGIAC